MSDILDISIFVFKVFCGLVLGLFMVTIPLALIGAIFEKILGEE